MRAACYYELDCRPHFTDHFKVFRADDRMDDASNAESIFGFVQNVTSTRACSCLRVCLREDEHRRVWNHRLWTCKTIGICNQIYDM